MPTFKAPHISPEDPGFKPVKIAAHFEDMAQSAAERRRGLPQGIRALTALTDMCAVRAAEIAPNIER
jgi:hypothetical protein